MSHVISRPITLTGVPTRRRAASRTVANASGSRSSRTAATAWRYSFSTPPCPSVPLSSASIASRSDESVASCFAALSSSIFALSAAVCSVIVARKRAVFPRSSSSETSRRRA